MPTSTILSDNGISSGTTGIKTAGGDDGSLILQTTNSLGAATTALTINTTQVVSLVNALPAGSGGTGVNAAGTAGNVLTSNGTAWVSQAAAAGGGDYIMNVYAGPSTGTWTKPAGLKAVKVTVVGGGGSSGASAPGPTTSGICQGGGGGGGAAIEYIDAPALPGPQPYTVGGAAGTSSFGSPAFLSATGGSTGGSAFIPGPAGVQTGVAGAAGGSGSGGQLNINGGGGGAAFFTFNPCVSTGNAIGGVGGNSIFGAGGLSGGVGNGGASNGTDGSNYGGGGGGGAKLTGGPTTIPQKSGGVGVVIVEEFY